VPSRLGEKGTHEKSGPARAARARGVFVTRLPRGGVECWRRDPREPAERRGKFRRGNEPKKSAITAEEPDTRQKRIGRGPRRRETPGSRTGTAEAAINPHSSRSRNAPGLWPQG